MSEFLFLASIESQNWQFHARHGTGGRKPRSGFSNLEVFQF
jgi:hypothetical protein